MSTGEPDGPLTSLSFTAGWYAEASADTPDMLEIALDKPEYKPGDTMTVALTARTAGKVLLNVASGDPAASQTSGAGGGVLAFNDVSVLNSTISGNIAFGTGGGIDSVGGPVDLFQSTVSGSHCRQLILRLVSSRVRRASWRAISNSPGTCWPIPKYISSGV